MAHYLTHEEVLVIHAKIVDETGGAHGIRDIHRIASLVKRPKMQYGGADLYPTLSKKAAVYFHSTALDHPFIDGNKRTAIALAVRFLHLNDYEFSCSNAEMEKFVLDAVVKKYEIKAIAEWLKKHSKKTS